MSYLNQTIRRTWPATRAQCAVYAVLSAEWASPDAIWRRGAVYADNKHGRIRSVAYGTVQIILRGLVQQGLAETRGGTRKQYRSKSCQFTAPSTSKASPTKRSRA